MTQRAPLELRLWEPEASPTDPYYGYADILDQNGDTIAAIHADEVDGRFIVNLLAHCALDEIIVKTREANY